MTNDLTAVRWAVLVALMLLAVALAGGAASAALGGAGMGSGQVLSIGGDPDGGGE
jgi:hypothetical protein